MWGSELGVEERWGESVLYFFDKDKGVTLQPFKIQGLVNVTPA